jgi:hypothetical protein
MPGMTRSDPRQMARWLARRERHHWSWAELGARSGHPVWRLRYWQRRLTETTAATTDHSDGFVTVDITGPEPGSASNPTALEIITPSGYRVAVVPGFDAEHLRRVLRELAAAC